MFAIFRAWRLADSKVESLVVACVCLQANNHDYLPCTHSSRKRGHGVKPHLMEGLATRHCSTTISWASWARTAWTLRPSLPFSTSSSGKILAKSVKNWKLNHNPQKNTHLRSL
jgi:hypothetical protein